MTIFERVMSDGVDATDDATPVAVEREFCWTGHVHFMARDLDDARAKLARYFDMVRDNEQADAMFLAGQMTIGAALIVHQPQANPEVQH